MRAAPRAGRRPTGTVHPIPPPSRAVRIAAIAAVLLALLVQPALAGGGLFVGAADDGARSLDPVGAKARLDLAALAGFGAVRMTFIWSPGQTAVSGDDLQVLRNAATAAQLDGVRLIVSVYQRDHRTTPLSSRARGEFAEYAASIVRAAPSVRDVVVGNEPNLNLFWMPQFGVGGVDLAARAYERLLAKTYDVLKSVSPDVNVIGGALSPHGSDRPGARRQTHSPTAFIRDVGDAYRRSGRTRPLMDMLALHPYLIPSRLPPSFAHPRTTTIGIADYPKLVRLLQQAFKGTAQRGAGLPIVYDEFGYQSEIPAAQRWIYRHLNAPAAADAIPERRQAAYYREAFALAACQPTVAGILIFHVADERDARAWQSGVYYANWTPKSSLPAVRAAALAAQAGTLASCADAAAEPVEGVVFREPGEAFAVDLDCALPCAYRAQVLDAATGAVLAATEGDAVGAETIRIPPPAERAGSYQYALRIFTAGRPGTAVERYSRPFAAGSFGIATAEPKPALPQPFPRWLPATSLPQPTLPLPTLLPTLAAD